MQAKKKKIIVSVSNDLVTDQRVHKVCNTLVDSGFELVLTGRLLKGSQPVVGRNYQCVRFKLIFNKGFLFYFCLNARLFFYLIFKRFDILLANDADTLPAHYVVSRIRRKKIFYDSHEIFPEVPELNNKKFVKKFWRRIEKICLPGVYRAYTVSESVAKYYSKKYKIDFSVVRNLPNFNENIYDFKKRPNIIIYQGALNKDRGLELLIEAMQFIGNYKLMIVGEGDLSLQLRNLSAKNGLSNKIEFAGKIPHEKLREITSTALLGFSLEQNTNLNYYYSLPNKFFDYINAGVPVLCSDFPEMAKITDRYKTGRTFSGNTPQELAETIIAMLDDRESLYQFHKNCVEASKELCWEKEETKLKGIFGIGF